MARWSFPFVDWFEVLLDVVAVLLGLVSLVFLIATITAYTDPNADKIKVIILPATCLATGAASWGMLRPRVVPAVRRRVRERRARRLER